MKLYIDGELDTIASWPGFSGTSNSTTLYIGGDWSGDPITVDDVRIYGAAY